MKKSPSEMTREELLERVGVLESQLQGVTDELAETNLGVVALYGELDERAQQLSEAIELKSKFLSYMSHEFKTPLSVIITITRILDDCLDGPLTDEQRKQVNFINSSANDLSEMVNDLLDLARIEAGRLTVSPEWFEMVDLFGALRGMFKPLVTNTEVNLIFEAAPDIPAAFTDHKKLLHILRNFISNALKFTEKGEVRVSARMASPEMAIFSVTDTGIGIPQEYHQSIFEDFVQINSSIQRRYKGTGLGLALCKKMAQLLKGTIGVESEMGAGSTFFVTLPLLYTPTEESIL